MAKVAKLVTISFTTRVIVDENSTEDEIFAASYKGFQDKLDNREVGDNCTEIAEDTECPFGTFDSDK